MKKLSIVLALVLVVAMALPASAAVEELTAGGSIVIRGQVLMPGPGAIDDEGPFTSAWANDDNADLDWITQRTRVNVDAKLSGGVRGFVELQAFDFWGVDTGYSWWEGKNLFGFNTEGSLESSDLLHAVYFDTETLAGQGNEPVKLYQAYIEMNDIADFPLRLRIGRQEMTYGREWLVGNNDAGINFSGLSFDAVRFTYDTDMFTVDAWYSKLFDFSDPRTLTLISMGASDFSSIQGDTDIDFHGVYGTYKGIDNMAIDAYVMLIRDASNGASGFLFSDSGSDENLMLWTVGGRVAGGFELAGGMLDYNVEAAFQFGDDAITDIDGDSGDYKGWAFNAMAGYTFDDVAWTPRLEGEYAYFSGDDDFNDGDSETFIRMFSDVHYGEINLGQNLDVKTTNLHIVRVGASAVPAEKLTVSGDFYWFLLAEDDADGAGLTFGLPQVVDPDDSVGFELDVAASYQYTEDLNLRVGWAHFFVDDAFEQSYGADFSTESFKDDDIDYLYVQAALTF